MELNVKKWYQARWITEHGNHKTPLLPNRRVAEKYIKRMKQNFQGDYIANVQIIEVKQVLTHLDFDDSGIPIPTFEYEEIK
jgi:uncharacterized NAD(P)/FAD-binding protein YdhS|tara:strand:+ start:953 stop:1195 length:243 start_codon:yes stop_codon:yes gene_type:complete